MSTSMEQNREWQNMEMERRIDKELIDEFPLGTLSFSVDMDELVAMNNGESGLAPQASNDEEEFHINEDKPLNHNSLISDVHLNNHVMSQNSKPSTALNLARPRAERKAPVGGKWSQEEDNLLREIVEEHGPKCWKKVAGLLGATRTDVQCLHRWNKVLKPGLHKGTWTKEEDQVVLDMVTQYGVGKVKWSSIAAKLPGRIGKQCRERWFNHLDPNIKKGEWMNEEELIIYEAQRCFGNRWCEISKLLPGRTENAVKNRWNSCAMRKWLKDRNLEGGPNMNLRNSSKAETYQAVMNFRRAITNAGVELSAEALQALSAFNENNENTSEDEYSDAASVATNSANSVRSLRSEAVTEAERVQEPVEVNMFKDEALKILKSDSSDSVMNSVLNYDLHEQQHKSSSAYSLYRIPIDVKEECFQSLQPEEYHVVDALHRIKQSPYSDMLASPSRPAIPMIVSEKVPEVQTDAQLSKRLKVADKSGESESNHVSDNSAQHSSSPTGHTNIVETALEKTKKIFLTAVTGSNSPSAVESVPLESIAFFKFLSEDAQRSILLNLFTQFRKDSVHLKSFVLLNSVLYGDPKHGDKPTQSESTELEVAHSSSEKGRKRTALQAEVGADMSLADKMAVDAAVQFVQFVAKSNRTETAILLETLKTNDMAQLNKIIGSIILAT